MSRVFSVGPTPGKKAEIPTPEPVLPQPQQAVDLPPVALLDHNATSVAPKAPVAASKPRAASVAHVSAQELMDELRAIAGNDGQRVNTVEGRETATEYSRRVKASLAKREAEERGKLAAAMEAVKTLDLHTRAGSRLGADLLCASLADGVLTCSLAIAAELTRQLLASASPPAAPNASMKTDGAAEHELLGFRILEEQAQTFLASASDDEEACARARVVMWLGAVFLNVFVSANWTGPPMKDLDISPLPWHRGIKAGGSTVVLKGTGVVEQAAEAAGAAPEGQQQGARIELASKQALEEDSEMFYRGAMAPMYLRGALCLLIKLAYSSGAPATLAWWGARAIGTQQRLLLGRSASLHTQLFALWEQASGHMKASLSKAAEQEGGIQGSRDRDARLQLEIALAHSSFYNDVEAEHNFKAAQERSCLRFDITGKVGIRRKFQTNHLPQLVCLANSAPAHLDTPDQAAPPHTHQPAPSDQDKPTPIAPPLPAGLGQEAAGQDGNARAREEDDADFDGYRRTVGAGVTVVEKNDECDILDGVRLDEDQEVEEQRPLSNTDQAILLTVCAWNRRNRARDEMNQETQGAIVDRVMLHPTNWIVFTTCLLSRCRIEMTKVQTVDRACLQMQVLADQFFDMEPGVSERVAFVYSVPFPPRWSLKKELADAMMKIGMLRTAATVYEELGLYKEMVDCYVAQGEEEEAEKIVRAQLEQERTPYMLAVMGFIKEDEAWYEESWAVSGGKFALARRWQGQLVYKRGDYRRAIALLEEALSISSFYPESWFKLGCAAMREEQWATSIRAFHRVVALEPDSFESWGNIGAVHMGQGKHDAALHAFQEALRLRRDSWKMWQNYRQAAIHLERWALVLNATCQLLNLKDKEVDVPILGLLVQECVRRMHDTSGEGEGEGEEAGGEAGGSGAARGAQDTEASEAKAVRDARSARSARDSFCERVQQLLKQVSCSIVDDPKFWQVPVACHA
jgi:tetratricopeptide (TPR) repeat protein